MTMKIPVYNQYTNVRAAASTPDNNTHGISPAEIEQMHARLSGFEPRLASVNINPRDILTDSLPKGASWDVRTGQTTSYSSGTSGGGRHMVTQQLPYQPEFSSPDRQQYPVHRILANRYWRLFNKLDPVIGNCIEMYATLPWSNFELTGDGVEGEIRHGYEQMCKETQLLAILPQMTSEFHVVGEAIPHAFFDNDKGIFTHIALHNPDQLEVIDTPFIRMDPILEFIPDDKLRGILTSDNPALRAVKERMPPELLSRLNTRANIPLSPINTTFIPRKLHPYDTRGTSKMSRLWRVLMLEDAIFNATLQTARRHSCFVAGTQVLMASGLKNIEDIKVGDKVVAGNGKIETVEAAWQEPPSPTVTIRALGTEPLTCTPNHNFLIWKTPRTCACGCGKMVKRHRGYASAFVASHNSKRNAGTGRLEKTNVDWKIWSESPKLRTVADYNPIQKVPAGEITKYDYLLIPRKFDEINTNISTGQARLLGYYVAEGFIKSVNTHAIGGVSLSFGEESCPDEQRYTDDIIDICNSLDVAGVKYTRNTPSTQKSGRVSTILVDTNQVKDQWLAHWLLNHGGRGAATKVLSEEVMRWPLHLKRELIKGLFRGDGSRTKCSSGNSHQVAMGLASRAVVNQVRLILAQLGIFSSISPNPRGSKHPDWSDTWILSSTGADARALKELVFNEHVNTPWDNHKDDARKGMKTWMDDDYIYVPITSVEVNRINVPVYNLTVSGDHSYIANAVQTFNSPLKVAKLGNATTGWIPPPEQEKRLLELLAQAETDPNAWLVYHYGIQFETIGTTDRAMTINREWDVIERIKLIALGISKSFLHGEVSYASSATGLQVFLQRLKSLRLFFEQKWIYPKLFRPIAEINGWVKREPSEIVHRYRVKRSAQELTERNAYITPRIVWDKSLDPQINTDLINAMNALERLGVKFSKTSKMATVGYSFEEETKKIDKERRFEKQFLPAIDKAPEGNDDGGMGMPGGGSMPPPPTTPPMDEEPTKAPPGTEGEQPGGTEPTPVPAGATRESPQQPSKPRKLLPTTNNSKFKNDNPDKSANSLMTTMMNANLSDKSELQNVNMMNVNPMTMMTPDKNANLITSSSDNNPNLLTSPDNLNDLINLLSSSDTDSTLWKPLLSKNAFKTALMNQDTDTIWNEIDEHLSNLDYSDNEISMLQRTLEGCGALPSSGSTRRLEALEQLLPDDTGSLTDEEFAARVQAVLRANGPVQDGEDNFLSGSDNATNKELLGDISHLMNRR